MDGVMTRHYGDKIVFDHFSFSLPEQGFVYLAGPSGKGKTTFLRLLCSLENNEEGCLEAFYDKRFSFVFQEDRLCPTLTAYENVALVEKDGERIRKAFLDLGIAEYGDKVTTFSGGMKRRTAIIRACLAPFDILLLDEPFTGLDPLTKAKAATFIKASTVGKLVVLVSHEEADVALFPIAATITL